jgi:iron complex outermembrane receptor protein
LVAVFCVESIAPAAAQTASEAERLAGTLPPVLVSPPKKRSSRDTHHTAQDNRRRGRTDVARIPRPTAPTNPNASQGSSPTPLNSNAVAASASRLGLTVRETLATVEVVGERTIQERGYRTVSDVAQGAAGVTAGDNPAEPAAFSMRGFTNSQINTLYNGIKIGPQNMTSRITDTANLEAVEFLKGPASLTSGEGSDIPNLTLSRSMAGAF